MSLSLKAMLQSYEICKKVRDPGTCKELAIRSAQPAIKSWLTAYDVCVEQKGAEWCNNLLSPEKNTICKWALIIGVISLAWRIIK